MIFDFGFMLTAETQSTQRALFFSFQLSPAKLAGCKQGLKTNLA